MEAIIFLSIIIALFSIFVSCLVIRRVKKRIAEITDALADVKNGNGNRRILSATNELVAPMKSMRLLYLMRKGCLLSGRQKKRTASL